ncbi:MAG: hypothetical protein A2Z16_13115 [Chloroflexi bacterium RBG_16_54_18]|nr:MAG: hypothetical protein A2Z16_13115 [Chloroflexi bacterium RBG_16_54_18]
MANTLPPGTLLKNSSYRIDRLLGQGGFGAVYLADDMILEKQCAIKESQESSSDAQAQFEVEARILANLNQPHLPRVTDNFIEKSSGLLYLVMEYVEGQNLGDLVAQVGPLPEEKVVEWADQVLGALAYLHAHRPRPIIHRDVKPDNIRLLPDGRTVKLVDFGIAKLGGAADATHHGARGATPGFAPPEQYGSGTSPSSDVYSLGATLYILLTGSMPPDAIDRAYAKKQLAPPRQLNPKISEKMEQIILTAMQLDPTLRFPDAQEMRMALQGSRPAEVLSACPYCQKPVKPNARFCPSCGKKISTARPFVFNRSGVHANNLSELVSGIDEHWEEALEYFQRGELDPWLAGLSPEGEKLAQQGQTLRLRYSDPSAAMESFLVAAEPTRPRPILEADPESLDFETLRRGESRSLELRIANRGRGYLHGKLKPGEPWVRTAKDEFGCLAGAELTVEMQVVTEALQVLGSASQFDSSLEINSNGGEVSIPVRLRLVESAPPRPGTRFFMDPSNPGTLVNDLPGMVRLCDENWEEAVYWLLSRRIEEFLGNLRQEKLRQAAEIARQQAEPNAGLESVLRLAGAQMPEKFSTNAREVLSQLGYGLFPKRGAPSQVVTLTIHNASKRGYLHGQVKPLVNWLSLSQPGFGCLPGRNANIELQVDRLKRKSKKISFRRPLIEIILL